MGLKRKRQVRQNSKYTQILTTFPCNEKELDIEIKKEDKEDLEIKQELENLEKDSVVDSVVDSNDNTIAVYSRIGKYDILYCEGSYKYCLTEDNKNIIDITEETVICENTLEIYSDNKEASKETGVSASGIKKCCNGNSKSAGKDENGNKLTWKYCKDVI